MNNIHIRVKTEALQETVSDVRSQVSTVRSMFDQMGQIVCASASYWDGSGRDAYMASWNRKKDQIERFLRMYEENADDLEKIAGIYVQGEKAAEGLSADLYADVIV